MDVALAEAIELVYIARAEDMIGGVPSSMSSEQAVHYFVFSPTYLVDFPFRRGKKEFI